MPAKSRKLDFSNVKERKFTKKNVPLGDYIATVTAVEDAKSKNDNTPMYLYTIQLKSVSNATYPVYCKLDADNLWKLKTLFACAGLNIPKKLVNLDPNRVVGRDVGVTMDEEEYNNRMQGTVGSFLPVDEVEEDALDGDGGTPEDEDDEEEEETPKAKKKKKAAPVDDDDDDDEEEEEEEPAPKKKKGKKGKKSKAVDDDELEELEVEEI